MTKLLLLIFLLTPLPVSAFPGELEPKGQQPYEGQLPDNSMTINNWMNKMRQWELEQTMRDPAFDINNALAEFFNGSDGSTEQE